MNTTTFEQVWAEHGKLRSLMTRRLQYKYPHIDPDQVASIVNEAFFKTYERGLTGTEFRKYFRTASQNRVVNETRRHWYTMETPETLCGGGSDQDDGSGTRWSLAGEPDPEPSVEDRMTESEDLRDEILDVVDRIGDEEVTDLVMEALGIPFNDQKVAVVLKVRLADGRVIRQKVMLSTSFLAEATSIRDELLKSSEVVEVRVPPQTYRRVEAYRRRSTRPPEIDKTTRRRHRPLIEAGYYAGLDHVELSAAVRTLYAHLADAQWDAEYPALAAHATAQI